MTSFVRKDIVPWDAKAKGANLHGIFKGPSGALQVMSATLVSNSLVLQLLALFARFYGVLLTSKKRVDTMSIE